MGFTILYDATHANTGSLPAGGMYAGYVTGSGDIPWNAEDWAKFPNAVRIDQTPASSPWDATADVDDMERGAVTLPELAPRAKLRIASFHNGTRPGQREPLVYASASNITPVANALIAGGVTSGVGLWVANWNLTEPEAVAEVLAASGPFPIRAVQYRNAGAFDMSVVDTGWLSTVSGKPAPPPAPGTAIPAPPGRWERGAVLMGVGTDGNVWAATYLVGSGWNHPVKVL